VNGAHRAWPDLAPLNVAPPDLAPPTRTGLTASRHTVRQSDAIVPTIAARTAILSRMLRILAGGRRGPHHR
jgi:hypothetical protein